MSFAELSEAPNSGNKKTVTILPSTAHYDQFEALVEKQWGNRKQSHVISNLVHWFNQNANLEFKFIENYTDKRKVTLSIDRDLWETFSDKVMRLFSKDKIKSAIISSLVHRYVQDHS